MGPEKDNTPIPRSSVGEPRSEMEPTDKPKVVKMVQPEPDQKWSSKVGAIGGMPTGADTGASGAVCTMAQGGARSKVGVRTRVRCTHTTKNLPVMLRMAWEAGIQCG